MARPLQSRHAMRTRRGFTLTELMIVVAIVGILAALALYGLRRYQQYASTGEATAMLQGMRGKQENFRAENLTYAGCNAGGFNLGGAAITDADLFPRALGALDDRKMGWDGVAGDLALCFRAVGIRSDGPVRFGYGMTAGNAGQATPANMVSGGTAFTRPYPVSTPPEPWYILVAIGDRDDDNTYARLATISLKNEVYMEDESE